MAVGRTAVIVGLYVALEWLSYLHDYKGIPVTPWNPALGLAFGLAVLRGPIYAVLLGLGVFLAETLVLRIRIGTELIAAVALVSAAGYGVAAMFLRRKGMIDLALPRLRDVVVLLSVAIATALITDTLLAALLLTDERIEQNDFFTALLPLAVGDAIGIAVFAPIVLRLAEHVRPVDRLAAILPNTRMVGIASLVVLAIVGLYLAFGVHGSRYLFILFVPVVFAAVHDGIDGACFSLAAAQLGLVSVLHATGQDVPTFIEVQAQMLVLTITGLIVGAIVSERQAMASAARTVALRLRRLEHEAARVARFNLAEGMASALAHEINQPITAVRALARSAQHLIQPEQKDLERANRNLTEMIVQVDHASQIVRRMREFLRRGHPHISTLDISMLLRNAVALIESEATAGGVCLVTRIEDGLPSMFGDRTQIQQVLLNLMRNSLDALKDARRNDGLIVIGAVRGSTSDVFEFFVSDNGPGIAPDLTARLFDPLTSTKPQGLGLGLAICATIVHHHRGRLWLAVNEPGCTEFRFTLPIDAGDP